MSLYNGASASNFREYANAPRFNASTFQTVAVWVNPASVAATQWAFIARGIGTTSGEWTTGSVVGSSSLARAQLITASSTNTLPDTINWTNRQWFHYCHVFDGTTLFLYVNGRQRATLTLVGAFTQTSTLNVRLWMRTDASIVGDVYLEQFGWWGTAFTPAEVDALARGVDFTKIRRNDAIILDPLDDPNHLDLVANQGVNTGTLSIKERAPILRTVPNIILAKPKLMKAATRKNYDNAGIIIQDVGWQSVGAIPPPSPRARVAAMDVPQPGSAAVTLGATGWEPRQPASITPPPKVGADAIPTGIVFPLRTTGFEPAHPVPIDKPPGQGVNADADRSPANLQPTGWEPPPAITVSPRGKQGADWFGPWLAFLMTTGFEPPGPATTSPRGKLGTDWYGPMLAQLRVSGWEPAAPTPQSPRGRIGWDSFGPWLAFLNPTGWEPESPTTVSPRGKTGSDSFGPWLAFLAASGWEPNQPTSVSPKGRIGSDWSGPWLAYLASTGWEPSQPTPQSPRGRTGANWDGPLRAFLLPGGWEPAAPGAPQPRAPQVLAPLPLPAFFGALGVTGWEPPGPQTRSPIGLMAPAWSGPMTAFPLRSGGFEPLAPWTASPRGRIGVDFSLLANFVAGTLGATGWEPPGPWTISPRGRAAPVFDGPLVAFPLRASGWEPATPFARQPRPGIGVIHDAAIPRLSSLGVVGWESAAAFARQLARAAVAGGDAGPMAPPPGKTGWEPASPYLPRSPVPGQGWNFDGAFIKRVLGATGWEPESPRTRSPRGAPGPNSIGPWLAFLRASGWEPEAPRPRSPQGRPGPDFTGPFPRQNPLGNVGWLPEPPRTHSPQGQPGPNFTGPWLAFIGAGGWFPADPLIRTPPPRPGDFEIAWATLLIPGSPFWEFLFGPPSVVIIGGSATTASLEKSRTLILLAPFDE